MTSPPTVFFTSSNNFWWLSFQHQGLSLVPVNLVVFVSPHSDTKSVRGSSVSLYLPINPSNILQYLGRSVVLLHSWEDLLQVCLFYWVLTPCLVRTYSRYSHSSTPMVDFVQFIFKLTFCSFLNLFYSC